MDLRDHLLQFQDNLNILREREAKYANNVPLDLLNQIKDHKTAIELTEQALAGEIDEAEWREAMKPLVVVAKDLTLRKLDELLARLDAGAAGQAPGAEPSLAEAEERLAALPLDAIPDLTALPPGSRMVLTPNPLFVGRDDDLMALAKALKGGETAVIGQVAAATGLGGIGKTQLASEFVHRYGHYFAGGVFWLSMAEPGSVAAEVALCGAPNGLGLYTEASGLSLDEQVRLVLAAWQSPLPRLLVFDNCEDETLLAQWRPPSGGCRVLVTSRRDRWDQALGVAALPLGVLSPVESIELLRKFRPDLSDEAAGQIAGELGDLPLALHLAGSFLKRYQAGVSPEDYLARLREPAVLAHASLQGRGLTHSPTQHELDVGRTFAVSYERLSKDDETDQLALALLARAAYFAPGEPIPRALLAATVDLNPADESAALLLADGLARLGELGLLETGADGTLVLHRLLALFVINAAADETAQAAVETAVYTEANRLNKAGLPGPLLAWQPHLRAVTEAAQERYDEWAAGLGNELGAHLNMIGDYVEARRYVEQALAIRERVLGLEHSATASSLNNLGALLKSLGDYAGARPYYERALAIREQVLGAEHPDTAQSLNNLGMLLQAEGDYAGARRYVEQALAIKEQVLGLEHPATALSLSNLGFLLKTLGDYAGARSYYERALAINEKMLGPEHPDTARSLNNLGVLLQTDGDHAGARPYYERALAIREQVWGAEHPAIATSLNNLGALLRAEGDYAGARSYYERALAINKKMLGPEHPETATSLNNLGLLLHSIDDYAGARPYYERALTIRGQVLGAEHPDTASSLNNLGALLRAEGDYAGARRYVEQALAIYEKVLGPEHPDTASSLNNLGFLLQDMGDYAGARPYVERALAVREQVLGPEHPDTATSLNNLGGLLDTLGDYAGARPYYERALAIWEQVLGPEHSNTRIVRGNLAALEEE